MKIKIDGNELLDPEIQAVSLVKRGANRSPFKILKSENQPYAEGRPQPPPAHAGSAYAENEMGRDERELRARAGRAPVSDRYGAQAGQTSERERNPLNVRKDHSLDALVRHAWARSTARRR